MPLMHAGVGPRDEPERHDEPTAAPSVVQARALDRETCFDDLDRTSHPHPDRSRSPLWNIAEMLRFPVTSDHLARLLSASAHNLNFDYFSYISLTGSDAPSPSGDQVRYFSNQQPGWILRYKRDHLHLHDPVVALCKVNWKAFAWNGGDRDLCADQRQRRVMACAHRFGLRCGITAPVHGPNRGLSLLTFSTNRPRIDLLDVLPEIGSILSVFGVCIGSWMESHPSCTVEPEQTNLSMRERECLFWTALGKTSWEIAKIIGRSEDTVNFHLKKASGKLNAANKCHAVTKAITQGYLLL